MCVKKEITEHIEKFEIQGPSNGAPEDSRLLRRDTVSLGMIPDVAVYREAFNVKGTLDP
jgi:hypothetical protein